MDKMREEFEDWAKREGIDINVFSDDEENSGQYYFLEAHCAWLAWQASRAALCVEFTKPRDTDSSGLSCYDEYWREDVEEMLNSAGVSHK